VETLEKTDWRLLMVGVKLDGEMTLPSTFSLLSVAKYKVYCIELVRLSYCSA